MNKMLLLSSLLLLSFGLNGCTPKTIIPTPQETPQENPKKAPHPITPVPIKVISTPTAPITPPIQVTAGESHQLKSIQGSMITIEERSNGFFFPQYSGKTILLQIFGQDCHYCLEEMPFIKNMQRKYAQKLNLVAIHADIKMTPSEAQNVLRKFQMDYPVIDRDEANNLLFFIKDTYNWNGSLPFMLLIKNGVTEYIFSGELDKQEFEESLRSIL